MGYDYSKTLKDFNEFSKRILIEEKDISSTADYNLKKPNAVLQNIHYEYLPEKEKESNMVINLGLFSKSDIMAYVFVFDYNDNKSLTDMLELYTRIITDEDSKGINENLRTIKAFICNKYNNQVNFNGANEYTLAIQKIIDKDERAKEIGVSFKPYLEQLTKTLARVGITSESNPELYKQYMERGALSIKVQLGSILQDIISKKGNQHG